MSVGDLVQAAFDSNRRGILIERVQDPFLGIHSKVFTVLWEDGTIGNNIWDRDLEAISERD